MTEPIGPAAVLAAKDEQIAALERQVAIQRACRETGLPAEVLAGAATAEEVERIATDALAWRVATSPPEATNPPTAAVSASVVTSADRIGMATGQIRSRDQLAQLPPAERLRAWREGRLASLGVAQPPRPRPTPLDR
jgi:hypothetical protein